MTTVLSHILVVMIKLDHAYSKGSILCARLGDNAHLPALPLGEGNIFPCLMTFGLHTFHSNPYYLCVFCYFKI